LICPDCQTNTRVKETRKIEERPIWTKRKRYCPACDKDFWTIEMPATDVNIGDENEPER
jgi:transcriptional regulator NrdR family protein